MGQRIGYARVSTDDQNLDCKRPANPLPLNHPATDGATTPQAHSSAASAIVAAHP
jgi:hypothetical protein